MPGKSLKEQLDHQFDHETQSRLSKKGMRRYNDVVSSGQRPHLLEGKFFHIVQTLLSEADRKVAAAVLYGLWSEFLDSSLKGTKEHTREQLLALLQVINDEPELQKSMDLTWLRAILEQM